MINTEQIRLAIQNSTLEDARIAVVSMIRRAARNIIFTHANRHYIYDFESLLVGQRHRDRRDQIVAAAQVRTLDATRATSVAELLAIFDAIAANL